jgi:hypothetical protein
MRAEGIELMNTVDDPDTILPGLGVLHTGHGAVRSPRRTASRPPTMVSGEPLVTGGAWTVKSVNLD